MMHLAGLAPCRAAQLNSNVRQRSGNLVASRCSAEGRRPSSFCCNRTRRHQNPRSGRSEMKTNSMCQARIGSADRAAMKARHQEWEGGGGVQRKEGQASRLLAAAVAREQGKPTTLRAQAAKVIESVRQSPCASSLAGSRPGHRTKALPNPSLKPRPNSKAPGPRYSAVHHLQRGPGAFPSVPA